MALRIGLLGLGFRPVKVAHDLGDRDNIAGIDLGLVFLRPARPHRAFDPGAPLEGVESTPHERPFGKLAHAYGDDLGGRHPQRHLVLDEMDDEQLELGACDLLLLNGNDLADAMGRVNDELGGLEALALGGLLAVHSGARSFVRLASADGRLGGSLCNLLGNRLGGRLGHSARYLTTRRRAGMGFSPVTTD